jgi:hypothetical protein
MQSVHSDYWHKQASDKPLYPDLLWSRPENKQHAGKLLIVGGNQFGFVEPADAYRAAEAAGIGTARMFLPDSLRPYVGKVFTAGELAPSTPSGSLSQQALGLMLQEAEWADGVLLAGGLGRNSETAILLEKFIGKYGGQLTIAKDAADYFTASPQKILDRPHTLFVISLAQLQKLAANAKYPQSFTFGMDLIRLVDALHDFTQTFQAGIIVKHLENIFAASDGQVSSTKLSADQEIWRVKTAARAATWWIQNPAKPFETLTTAIYETIKD